MAGSDADKTVRRAVPEGSSQKEHYADPTHPVPTCIRKYKPERESEQQKAFRHSKYPIQASYVELHRQSLLTKSAILFAPVHMRALRQIKALRG